MVGFLKWMGAMVLGTVNGFVKLFLAVIVIGAGCFVFALWRGDGLPKNMVLSLDLRGSAVDSAPQAFVFGEHKASVMDIVLNLDAAQSDKRIKGVFVRLGSGGLSVAQAEEIGAALKRFRARGKFVVVHAQGFFDSRLGDYLAATAGEIWMQPHSMFLSSGEGAGRMYLRGLFDKIGVNPQIAKRAEYKSAADTYMAAGMSAPDREQITALLQSHYATAVADASSARKMRAGKLAAALDGSPQSSETARRAGLIDKLGYDDDAERAALKHAGDGAKMVDFSRYVEMRSDAGPAVEGTKIAVISVCGTIVDGRSNDSPFAGDSASVGGDDLAKAIRDAAKDDAVKAIILRVDSPGGSVTASDQILDAVKKARKAGKPIVVSMGAVAASGGYYISLSADRIVAEPATITGSIGVFTGKMSFDKTLAKVGIGTEQIGVGRNALMQSPYAPYTDEQWAAVNAMADAIYDDFTAKVAGGRKLPLAKVRAIAKGRIWSGTDAKERGLVDRLGGFWTAVDTAKGLAKIRPDARISFVFYPRAKGVLETVREWFGGATVAAKAVWRLSVLLNAPAVEQAASAVGEAPHGMVELRAVGLPR